VPKPDPARHSNVGLTLPAARFHLLTILRFVAATWVVLLHFSKRLPIAPNRWCDDFFSNGGMAMTLFFVLSGTVVAYGYRHLTLDKSAVWQFYLARWTRIYPAYLATHLIALIWFTPLSAGSWPRWLYVNLLSLFGIQAWFPQTILHGANAGTWSISVEFAFYAAFPVLLCGVRRWRESVGTARLCFIAWCACSFFGIADYAFRSGLHYYIVPHTRLPEFILGIVLGLEIACAPSVRWRDRLVLALGVVGTTAVALSPLHRFGVWTHANLITVPAFACLIYGLARLEQLQPISRASALWRGPIYLGDISYCLFLAHLIPLLFIDSAGGGRWRQTALELHGPYWVAGVLFAVSLGGAVLLHEAVEKPVRRAILRRSSSPPGLLIPVTAKS
jgi:peptidoglycan/LPS O-acetylase OafA/YrhL